MKNLYRILGLSLCLSTTVMAQSLIPDTAREHLVVHTPDGWYMAYQKGNLHYEITEFVPRGQKIEAWKDLLAYSVRPPSASGVLEAYMSVDLAAFDACQKVERTEPVITRTNDLSIGYVTVKCWKPAIQTGSANLHVAPYEVYLFKYISNSRKVYKLWRAWHGSEDEAKALPADVEAAWRPLLDEIELCDLANPELSCKSLNVAPIKIEDQDVYDRVLMAEATEALTKSKINRKTPPTLPAKDRAVGIFMSKPDETRQPPKDKIKSEIISLSIAEHDWQSAENFKKLCNSIIIGLQAGREVTIVATNLGDSSRSRIEDRRLVGNYFLLIRKALFQAKVPYEQMQIRLPMPEQS